MNKQFRGLVAALALTLCLPVNGPVFASTTPSWESMVVIYEQPSITLECNGRTTTMTPEDLGLMIGRNGNDSDDVLVYQWDEQKFNKWIKQAEKELSLREPKDASVKWVKGDFVTTSAQKGYGIDEKKLLEQMTTGVLQSTYSIPLKEIPAKVQEDSLKGTKVLVGTYTTNFVKNQNRTTNMRLACKAFDGYIIKPGQVFSFNKVVGERTEKKGYKPAKIIVAGEFVDGLGGGICQVSSTMYNAVLQAGLEITERHSHSLGITYVPKGKDATVAYGSLDFKFKNNTKHNMELRYKIEGQKLTINLYAVKTK